MVGEYFSQFSAHCVVANQSERCTDQFSVRDLETKLIYICLTFFVCLQEIMMDHSLRSISYIADIGDLLVIMARRRIMPQDGEEIQVIGSTPKMICHVFESEEVRNVVSVVL